VHTFRNLHLRALVGIGASSSTITHLAGLSRLAVPAMNHSILRTITSMTITVTLSKVGLL
jgi:hypothetical protein